MTDDWKVGPYSLRPHQIESVIELRQAMRECRAERKPPNVLLQGVCSFGKTIVSSYLMQQAIAKGLKPAFIVRGRQLVFQKSDKLADADIPHTVVMANCKGHLRPAATAYEDKMPTCSVISKDTYESLLENHGVSPFGVDLWIIDEAHEAKSDGWWKIINTSNAPVVGVTATPCWRNGLGMGDRYSKLVVSTTHEQLINAGHIVPCRVIAPWGVDTRNVTVNEDNGEYVESQIEARCTPLVGDFIEEHHKHADGLTTAFFASSVAHSIAQAEAFCEGDGTLLCRPRNWVHIDAETPQKERKTYYRHLQSRDLDGVSNYAVLQQGADFKAIRCIQLGVAMNSLVSYLQTCGRGARPDEGKDEFVIIDHGHNVTRHGWPQLDREWRLDDRKPMWERERESHRPSEKHCPRCHAVYRASLPVCPYCGEAKVQRAELVKTVSGELVEVEPPTFTKREPRKIADEQKLWERLYFPSSKSKSLRPSTFNQLRARFMNDYPHLKIVQSGNRTVIVNRHTKSEYKLGFAPPPNSPLWDNYVRCVPSGKLQTPEYQGDGNGSELQRGVVNVPIPV